MALNVYVSVTKFFQKLFLNMNKNGVDGEAETREGAARRGER